MTERLSKLGVTQEAIRVSIEHSDPFEHDILSYVRYIQKNSQ